MKGMRDQSVRHLENRMKRLSGKVKVIGSKHQRRVVGMDIYIQPEEPAVSGDYLWIDTRGIDLVLE